MVEIMTETTVEERGRVLIPKEIRERLNIRGGQKVRIEVKDEEIRIKKVGGGDRLRNLKGCVSDPGADPMEAKTIWNGSDVH